MMLFKLSFKNIKKSFKDYAIYFFTLILGVAIFYVFNAIESQTVMMNVSSSTRDIIKLMTSLLSGVSVFVSFILGFLVIYASRFLIKRRKKEFGIYLTLGMGKRKISMILFFETLFIGVLSLIVGLGLGVVLSQFMSLLVANMFEADMTDFTFVFSSSACIKTLLYFGIIYFLVMIFNIFNISRYKLIDLLHAGKTSEKVKLKNPVLCTILFFLSLGVLSFAYYSVTAGIEDLLDTADKIYLPIFLGAISTFFLFFSLSGLILRIVMGMKKLYYKGLNSFTLRQISSKVNTTVFSMTLICLMLFVTICVLSSALSLKNSMTANLTTLAPVDVMFYKTLDLENTDETNPNLIEDSHISIRESLEKLDFSVEEYFTDVLEFQLYATNDIMISTTLGSYFEQAKSQFPFLKFDTAETFMKLSDYNKLAKLYHMEELFLEPNEYVLVVDYKEWISLRDEALKRKTEISLLGKTYKPKYEKHQNGFLTISSNHINIGYFVVPDEALDDSIRERGVMVANYRADSSQDKKKIEDEILSLSEHPYQENTSIEAVSKISIYESSVGLGALATFIGLYLGIIFLMSSAAILALKELSESSDNKERFSMLRKIGADEKMIHKALFRQIAIFFLFPLVIAIIHSIFGIMFCDYILSTFGNEQLFLSILMTAIFLILIYGGYFLITYVCSKNIIKEG